MAKQGEGDAIAAPAVALALAAVGLSLMLAGLVVDAVLHALDPALASREGMFAVGNPGHVLIGLGLALATIGLVRALTVAARGGGGSPGIALTGPPSLD